MQLASFSQALERPEDARRVNNRTSARGRNRHRYRESLLSSAMIRSSCACTTLAWIRNEQRQERMRRGGGVNGGEEGGEEMGSR
eukprot:758882-Hanusia_phi.AAC.3